MARRSIRSRSAHVLAAVLLVVSTMPASAADPGPTAPPARSAPNPRNIDPSPAQGGAPSLDGPATQPAFAPIGGGAFIDNGVIQLGVNPEGHLNVDGGPPSAGEGQTDIGLRWLFLNTDAISPGCLCEGWGAADATRGISGTQPDRWRWAARRPEPAASTWRQPPRCHVARQAPPIRWAPLLRARQGRQSRPSRAAPHPLPSAFSGRDPISI